MELKICHLYPDVLNLYGDGGNIRCLRQRLQWRGIGAEVVKMPIALISFSLAADRTLNSRCCWRICTAGATRS